MRPSLAAGPRRRPWSVARAESWGIALAILSAVLWVAIGWWDPLAAILGISLALTAMCGAFVLAVSFADLLRGPSRGRPVRVIRTFDLVLGALLTFPPLYGLFVIWPEL